MRGGGALTERERQTDRQTNRQTDRQIDRQTDREICGQKFDRENIRQRERGVGRT